jgi:hypothetical protein
MSRAVRNLPRLVAFLSLASAAALGSPRQQAGYDCSPINYSTSKPADPVADLDARLGAGQAKLATDSGQGYLKAVLAALDIPISSQALVFSKTSFQRQWISPRSPRALYFNDDVYIGWVQGGEVIEVASQDPQLGSIFYTLPQDGGRGPRFQRHTDACLQCHDSTGLTLGVPGVTIRSVYPGADGQPRFNLGGFRTSHRSPYEDRWGGWYVSGTHGDIRHLGNSFFPDDQNADLKPIRDRGANLTDLSKKFETEPYLTDTSDVVALLVLEYQTVVHNLITRANHETRVAVAQSDDINRALGSPLRPLTEGARRRVGYACEPLVEALLFAEEAPLTSPVKGNSTFAADFEKRGPFDKQGRSLRQFDLTKRLFKYPLSYLIYTKSFAGLPPDAKEYIGGRLKTILAGRDPKPAFKHLTAESRRAILEIVTDTLPELAARLK